MQRDVWWEELEEGVSFDLAGNRVLFLVGDDFDWYEVVVIRDHLARWNAAVTVASNRAQLRGHLWEPRDEGWQIAEHRTLEPDALLEEVNVKHYDGLFVPGGKGPENLLDQSREAATSIVARAHAGGKVVSAICHGPLLLAEAGILGGKRATAHPEVAPLIAAKGGQYVTDKVVRDGNIITGNWPFFATFSGELAGALPGQR